MKKINGSNFFLELPIAIMISTSLKATNYTVSTLAEPENRMGSAIRGDTVIVINGTYNWGRINLTNTKNNPSSDWIVLKAQSFDKVVFTGNTYFQFAGTRIHVTGSCFATGSVGTISVIQFRNSSDVPPNYCRLSNIIIDNYNSDSSGTADPANPGVGIDNKWVSLYGSNNWLDYCAFIHKYNAGATVVEWDDGKNDTYPGQSTSAYHRIDSNYFNGRGYKGGNGGESIRIGTVQTSISYGYNVMEYNLFENNSQK